MAVEIEIGTHLKIDTMKMRQDKETKRSRWTEGRKKDKQINRQTLVNRCNGGMIFVHVVSGAD